MIPTAPTILGDAGLQAVDRLDLSWWPVRHWHAGPSLSFGPIMSVLLDDAGGDVTFPLLYLVAAVSGMALGLWLCISALSSSPAWSTPCSRHSSGGTGGTPRFAPLSISGAWVCGYPGRSASVRSSRPGRRPSSCSAPACSVRLRRGIPREAEAGASRARRHDRVLHLDTEGIGSPEAPLCAGPTSALGGEERASCPTATDPWCGRLSCRIGCATRRVRVRCLHRRPRLQRPPRQHRLAEGRRRQPGGATRRRTPSSAPTNPYCVNRWRLSCGDWPKTRSSMPGPSAASPSTRSSRATPKAAPGRPPVR